jgi:hypothetical protein
MGILILVGNQSRKLSKHYQKNFAAAKSRICQFADLSELARRKTPALLGVYGSDMSLVVLVRPNFSTVYAREGTVRPRKSLC